LSNCETVVLGIETGWVATWLQVDQHVQSLRLVFREHQDIHIVGSLARKRLQPRQLDLVCCGYISPLQALSGLVNGGQHHQLLAKVKELILDGQLSKELLQVWALPRRYAWLLPCC
jgi:hypothetical protein